MEPGFSGTRRSTSTSTTEVKFDIGHVLFIDIVGYSKLLINEQSEQIQKLMLQRLVKLLAPTEITPGLLRLDPTWDPIRNDPRFQQLLAGKEQIGPNK